MSAKRRVTFRMDPEFAKDVRAAAAESGLSVSAWMTRAAAKHVARMRAKHKWVDEITVEMETWPQQPVDKRREQASAERIRTAVSPARSRIRRER